MMNGLNSLNVLKQSVFFPFVIRHPSVDIRCVAKCYWIDTPDSSLDQCFGILGKSNNTAGEVIREQTLGLRQWFFSQNF